MRRIILFIMTSFAVICQAQSGWNYVHLSVLYGGQYQVVQRGLTSEIEFLIDRGTRSCLSGPNYFGLGLIQRTNIERNELALKAYFNPFHRYLYRIVGDVKLVPHISLEGIHVRNDRVDPNIPKYYFRPGIGFHTTSFTRSIITWKSYLGVTFSSSGSQDIRNLLGVEFKLGIGLNPKVIGRNRRWKKEKLRRVSEKANNPNLD